jgi:uncharacterized membrane protein HdeD (DUF308 family)
MANTHAQSEQEFALTGPGLLRSLADNWWLLLLRGIAAVTFGVLAFFWPGLTLITLTWLWGAYALTDGVIAIWAAFNASGGDAGPRWWLGLSGVVSILAGFVAFYYTGMTTLVLLMFIAIWGIIIGAIQIWGAFALRSVLQGMAAYPQRRAVEERRPCLGRRSPLSEHQDRSAISTGCWHDDTRITLVTEACDSASRGAPVTNSQ